MNSKMRIPFVKPIALFGLLQLTICILGFLSVATLMKVKGYPDTDYAVNLMPNIAVFVRHWWFLIVLIPASWTIWASFDFENENSSIPPWCHYVTGGVLFIVTLWFFTNAAGAVDSFEVPPINQTL